MKSRWKTIAPLEPTAEYLVLASSIPPKSLRSTPQLFNGSRAVRRQLLGTDGVMGFAMLAEPLRRHYATLSVWRDAQSLDAFGRSHPHDELMAELEGSMAPTTFVRWTIAGTEPLPTWNDALERLRKATPSM